MKTLLIILLTISTVAFAWLAFYTTPIPNKCIDNFISQEPETKGHDMCVIDQGLVDER